MRICMYEAQQSDWSGSLSCMGTGRVTWILMRFSSGSWLRPPRPPHSFRFRGPEGTVKKDIIHKGSQKDFIDPSFLCQETGRIHASTLTVSSRPSLFADVISGRSPKEAIPSLTALTTFFRRRYVNSSAIRGPS